MQQPDNAKATGVHAGGSLVGGVVQQSNNRDSIVPQNGVHDKDDLTALVDALLDVPPPVADFQPPPRAYTDADVPGVDGAALPVAVGTLDATQVATITGGFVNAVDLLRKEFGPVQWAVDGILPEGAFVLGGRPKMGKSWLALSLALAVATGGRALGHAQVKHGDALVLALEDNERRLKDRLVKLLANDAGVDVSRLDVRTDCPRLDKGGTLVISAWLDAHPDARLVVVDTLAKVKPRRRPGGDAYAEDYDALQPLVDLAKRYRVTFLIITHLRKLAAGDDVFDAITGTLGTTGGCDGSLVLARQRGRADAVLHVTGRDLPRDVELALVWDETTAQWTAAGDAEEYRLNQLHASILAVIRDAGKPMTPQSVHTALMLDDATVKHGTVRQAMARMAQTGKLHLADYGEYELPTR